MPFDELDPKQIKRMRHIGNDHIHIIWNEHYRDYKKLISGDFGDISIIITPMLNGLYSIDLLLDEKVTFYIIYISYISYMIQIELFGPLNRGSVVPKAALGDSVRETAINAYRACARSLFPSKYLESGQNYKDRRDELKMMIQRHSHENQSFENNVHLITKCL